jgi:hypothetical protein
MPTLDFPSQVNVQPAPAVAGDFASTNPRAVVLAGPLGLVAGSGGLTSGLFAWTTYPDDIDGAPGVATNSGQGPVAGFVHRELIALITTYLADAGQTIPQGFEAGNVFTTGDFWVKNNGTTQALPGQTCFANTFNGQAVFAAAGSTPITATINGSLQSAQANFTGTVVDDVLTVTALSSGTIVVGMTLGTAGGVAANTTVTNLGSGTGTVGTYYVNIPEQSVASGSLTGTYSILTVGTISSGSIGVGSVITGGTVAGTVTVASLGTGTGGMGTYYLAGPAQSTTAAALTGNNAVSTKWIARSSGLPGELVKISSWLQG